MEGRVLNATVMMVDWKGPYILCLGGLNSSSTSFPLSWGNCKRFCSLWASSSIKVLVQMSLFRKVFPTIESKTELIFNRSISSHLSPSEIVFLIHLLV